MGIRFKRVPAVEKCFAILSLLPKSEKPLGISDISNALGYNKGTVFNTVHTLIDLGGLKETLTASLVLEPASILWPKTKQRDRTSSRRFVRIFEKSIKKQVSPFFLESEPG
jgi:DNA-binding IclR family transcriptional regulator